MASRRYTAAEILARAEEVGGLPHVQRWIRKFNALSKTMPKEIEMYIAAGSPTAMAVDPNGRTFDRPDGNSGSPPEAIVHGIVRSGNWDGGDW